MVAIVAASTITNYTANVCTTAGLWSRRPERMHAWNAPAQPYDTRANDFPPFGPVGEVAGVPTRLSSARSRLQDNTGMPTTSPSPSDLFTKLFAESRQALHRYILRFVGSSETAKEIVQEAFLRTYRER